MKSRKIRAIAPLQSWDIFAEYHVSRTFLAERDKDLSLLNGFIEKHQLSFDLDLFAPEEYTAIVITDHSQSIEWVNNGFTTMTGYPKSYAIGKHPRFLQGPETSSSSTSFVREAIKNRIPIEKQILNYKKDGTPYLCDIKIIPLFNNKTEQLTHFIAFEKKAKVA